MSDEKIYRFISFESLVDMLQRQALALVLPSMWEDPYEGFMYKYYLYLRENNPSLFNEIVDNVSLQSDLFYHLIVKNPVYGQCWTKVEENDAMWRIYGHGKKSVRVEVSRKNIKLLERVTDFDVHYKDLNEKNLYADLKKMIGKDVFDALLPFLIKRQAFQHEEEVRVLSFYFNGNNNFTDHENKIFKFALKKINERGEITDEKYKKNIGKFENKRNSSIRYISFANIENFIESVMVHPQADKWFVEAVAMFCGNNSVEFIGKSKLYELSAFSFART